MIGVKKHEMPIPDAELAQRIRTDLYVGGDSSFARSLLKHNDRKMLDKLEALWCGTTDNVQTVAFAIRNGVAHGDITPYGSGIRTPDRISIILDLADVVLTDADRRFADWVHGELSPASPS